MSVILGPLRFNNDADAEHFRDWAIANGHLVRELDDSDVDALFAEYKEDHPERDPDYDPTPWCSWCGAMKASHCACGPIAEND
jgi:hypothetical protein